MKPETKRVIDSAKAESYGFLSTEDVQAIANDPETRLSLLLVRCGGGRFMAPADQALRFCNLIESTENATVNAALANIQNIIGCDGYRETDGNVWLGARLQAVTDTLEKIAEFSTYVRDIALPVNFVVAGDAPKPPTEIPTPARFRRPRAARKAKRCKN